jgi:SAM-dependent methyltransferase
MHSAATGRAVRRILRLVQPLLPGWPDAGRRIVQTPALRAFLREAIRSDGTPRVVLNAGCGEGLFAPLLLSVCRPKLQIEMDLSPAGRRHLRSDRQRYVSGSLTHLPLATGAVDLVLCSEVIEHIPDDAAAVAEIARVLKPAGWLVLSVPTPPAVPDANHVREGYTVRTLETLLGNAGLTCLRTRRCMGTFFRAVLRYWRPKRIPRLAITTLAWMDRLVPVGPPMDLVLLARKSAVTAHGSPRRARRHEDHEGTSFFG